MNESVIIDGGIEVMVVAVHGNKVRLGFRAPADVIIKRQEQVTDVAGLRQDRHAAVCDSVDPASRTRTPA